MSDVWKSIILGQKSNGRSRLIGPGGIKSGGQVTWVVSDLKILLLENLAQPLLCAVLLIAYFWIVQYSKGKFA